MNGELNWRPDDMLEVTLNEPDVSTLSFDNFLPRRPREKRLSQFSCA